MRFAPYIALACILGACHKDEPLEPQPLAGTEYFPAAAGHFITFQVDSIVFTDLPRDTLYFSYQVKEKFAEEFTDGTGSAAFRLERSYRYPGANGYDGVPWRVQESRMVSVSRSSVHVTENNARYVKLVFPADASVIWDGNAFNNQGRQNYAYNYTGMEETISGTTMKTAQVRIRDLNTLISVEKRTETYAAGIGLVKKDITAIYSNTIVPGVPVEDRIIYGFRYSQKFLSYGNE